jgi:hypothetical protein
MASASATVFFLKREQDASVASDKKMNKCFKKTVLVNLLKKFHAELRILQVVCPPPLHLCVRLNLF